MVGPCTTSLSGVLDFLVFLSAGSVALCNNTDLHWQSAMEFGACVSSTSTVLRTPPGGFVKNETIENEIITLRDGGVCVNLPASCVNLSTHSVVCVKHNCVLPCVKTINQVHLMLCYHG